MSIGTLPTYVGLDGYLTLGFYCDYDIPLLCHNKSLFSLQRFNPFVAGGR